MALLRRVRNHPIPLLVVVMAVLSAWIAIDHIRSLPDPVSDPGTAGQPTSYIRTLPPPIMPEDTDAVAEATRRDNRLEPGVITPEVVSRLHPGMARADVEGIIGLPPADMVQPITQMNGRFTYLTSYLANLDPNLTPMSGSRPVPRTLIGLEFDATRPGHPLVKIHLPHPVS